ncbi:MAG: indole-3-glycerol phosphate synthase TrpC [Ilumatobacter sp.]|uniref:indole-3-glycerol phosphate synthase TrpC n=1 Tax=Ilumatobacter sp. TaxID=1967498 RepID=UPI003299D8C8
MSGTYLDKIVEHHRAAAREDLRSLDRLVERVGDLDPCRGFRAALTGREQLGVIAEIKRRSPSKGALAPDLDARDLARAYERGGAACLSVLTDVDHFGGSVDDLQTARAACSLPVLRKDFTVSELDVVDTRLMGADCLLLIAAAIDKKQLVAFCQLAKEIGLDVLVEIHDEGQLDVVLAADATLIGVNQRDLETFEVDHERAVRMADVIPGHAIKVAESGIRHGADARALESAGYQAVLVGEMLVTSESPADAIAELIG